MGMTCASTGCPESSKPQAIMRHSARRVPTNRIPRRKRSPESMSPTISVFAAEVYCGAPLPVSRSARFQVLVQEIDGALPGQFGRVLVVARRGVVVEAVIHAGINVRGVGDVIGFQRCFVGRPSAGDAIV